LPITIK